MIDLAKITNPDGSFGLNGDDGYIDFDPAESQLVRLDGLFSAEELRAIADYMAQALGR